MSFLILVLVGELRFMLPAAHRLYAEVGRKEEEHGEDLVHREIFLIRRLMDPATARNVFRKWLHAWDGLVRPAASTRSGMTKMESSNGPGISAAKNGRVMVMRSALKRNKRRTTSP
jgi:hypothetical protein